MQQVAEVMQQGGGHQCITCTLSLAECSGLQGVLQLRDRLAAVLFATARFK